jgi:glutathione S-transferase
MQLVGVSLSPYFERAAIVLDVKGALDKVEFCLPLAGFGTPEAKAENKTGKIPYLRLADGTILPEGQLIAEYFNDIFDGENMIPADPMAAYKAKLLGRIVDLYIGPHTTALARTITRGTRDEVAITEALNVGLPAGLDFLEEHLTGGKFAVGNAVSIGDASIIPHMFHFLEFLGDFGVDPCAGRPKLSAWWDNWRESDIVARSHGRMRTSLDMIKARRAAAEANA